MTNARRFLGICAVVLLTTLAGSGQAFAQIRTFVADLVPEDEMSLVESKGSGHADFQLDLSKLRLTWKVSYSGLTSRPIGAHLHGPGQMGTNALPFLDLAPNGMHSPLEGSATVTEAQVQYMISTWVYINIATERYKDGEIRAQLDGRTFADVPTQ